MRASVRLFDGTQASTVIEVEIYVLTEEIDRACGVFGKLCIRVVGVEGM